jgi:hypothetical protein
MVAAVPAWLWIAALVVCSAAVRTELARRHPAPWIFDDELIYWRLSVNFADTGRFFVRNVPGRLGYGPGYPVLIAPASLVFHELAHAYAAAKAMNSLFMSLAAVPAFLLARRLVGSGLAVLAAVFAVALPSLEYTGTIMTENAFYPAFLLCALAFARMLERPSPLRQLLALASIVPAFLIRAQAGVLVPALVTAVVILVLADAFAERERLSARPLLRRLDAFRVMWLALGAAAVILVAVQMSRGKSLGGVLGGYDYVTSSNYTIPGVTHWFVYQLGELDLYLGVVPFAALIVVCASALSPNERSRPLKVFAAVSVPLIIWITLSAAAYSSLLPSTNGGVGRIEERDAFYVAPLFLIALIVWAERGLPRRWPTAAVAATVAAALPGTLPLVQLVNLSALSDTLAFIPLARAVLRGTIPTANLSLVVVIGALIGAGVFLLLPRRMALLAPLSVLAYLIVWQTFVERQMRETSVGVLAQSVTVQRDWIDEHVGDRSHVVAIWTGNANRLSIPENEFFNRSVKNVYSLNGPPPLSQRMPEWPLSVDEGTGRLVIPPNAPLHTSYVLTDASIVPIGHIVASDQAAGMTLYRVADPVRLRARTSGRYADGWSGPALSYTRYGCRGGRIVASVSRLPGLVQGPQTVTITSGEEGAIGSVILRRPGPEKLTVPLRPAGGRCDVTLRVSPTAAPASVFGTPDARQLGVHVDAMRYIPAR